MFATWFRNLRVDRKIGLAVGFLSAVLVAMLALSIRDVGAAQGRTEAMYQQQLLPTGDLTAVRTSLLRSLVLVNNMLRADSPEELDRFEADMHKMDDTFDAAWARYEKSLRSEVALKVAPQYYALAKEQRRARLEFLAPLARKGDLAQARKVLRERIDKTDAVLGPLGAQLVKDNAAQAAAALEGGAGRVPTRQGAGHRFLGGRDPGGLAPGPGPGPGHPRPAGAGQGRARSHGQGRLHPARPGGPAGRVRRPGPGPGPDGRQPAPAAPGAARGRGLGGQRGGPAVRVGRADGRHVGEHRRDLQPPAGGKRADGRGRDRTGGLGGGGEPGRPSPPWKAWRRPWR